MAQYAHDLSPLRIVVVGHVDHGKSTLIGRLLHDAGALPESQLQKLRAACERRGTRFEWSFVLDAFQAERDQAVTIDTTQFWFRTAARQYVIIDAPGHREFLRNMITGAAGADAAVLVVDATEGMRDQTCRHAYLLHLLGLRRVVICVNKMDALGYASGKFSDVAEDIRDYVAGVGIEPAALIPISAHSGDNLTFRSVHMPWYEGPTLVEALDGLARPDLHGPSNLRLPIQDVYRIEERRILVGRIEAGTLRAGDHLVFSPSGVRARVKAIEQPALPRPDDAAQIRQAVGFTIDEPVFIERGEIASHVDSLPVLSSVFRATIFWLGKNPLRVGQTYKLKIATRQSSVSVQSIERVIDTQTLEASVPPDVKANEIAEVVLRAREILALDEHDLCAATGRCVLMDGYETAGGGIISVKAYPDQRKLTQRKASNVTEVDHLVTAAARAWRNGHRGAVIWFTGLSGAGKSTLAMATEYRLFNRGFSTFVLDGDNVRVGLNADLGFSPEDRAENIRRVGEAASLFAEAGLVVIASFISPYKSDRDLVRHAAGGAFHEIYIKADLETCEARDPKGLYAKARAGAIRDFTGISAPYEAPERPDLVIDTTRASIEACVDQAVQYVEERVRLKQQAGAA